MQLTFLEADVALTKSYTKNRDGTYTGSSYPNVFLVTSHVEQPESLADFCKVLSQHASKGHCLLSNNLTQPLVKESRAKKAIKGELRSWIIIDIDGLKNIDSAEEVIDLLPRQFRDVSYIIQHSPSSGIKLGIRVHVFFMLEDQTAPAIIKDWLMYTNLATQSLSDQITLSKNARACTYPLDVVPNDNGRIIYISAPECVGFSDPVTDRVTLVTKKYDTLQFSFSSMTQAQLLTKRNERISKLREAAGLVTDKKGAKIYEVRGTKEFVRDDYVEPARITSYEEDNDRFMRCNLDGGDSFAYYYHRNNPVYLHNFKGEPSVKLSILDPHYYETVALPYSEGLVTTTKQAFVFRDKFNDGYYVGIRKEAEIIEQPNACQAKDKIEAYFMQHGGMVPDPIMTYERTFNPTSEVQWLPDNEEFNTWRPTYYMINATAATTIPPIIKRIISHALGGHDDTTRHFLNWLAYIYQTRKKSGTAWVLHGCPGTGKGLLVNSIIKPIFGADYMMPIQIRGLRDNFNSWMEHKLFVNVDEARAEDAGHDTKAVVDALKLWITEETVAIRAMHTDHRDAPSFVNFIFTTNDFGILPIQDGDRRFNVGYRQDTPIIITDKEVDEIKNELSQFAGYLLAFTVDTSAVRTPLENEAKEQLKLAASSSVDEFMRAFRDEDFEYFYSAYDEPCSEIQTKMDFKKWLEDSVEDIRAGVPTLISVADLRDAYVVISGARGFPEKRFRAMLRKRGIFPGRARLDDDRVTGWKLEWAVTDEFKAELGAHIKSVDKTQEEIRAEIKKEVSGD